MINVDVSHLTSWCLLILIMKYVESSLNNGSKENKTAILLSQDVMNRTIKTVPISPRGNGSYHGLLHQQLLHKTLNKQKKDGSLRSELHVPPKKSGNAPLDVTPISSSSIATSLTAKDVLVTDHHHLNITNKSLLMKIHSTLTRSKDAVWATISITFICIVLLLAVAQSKMWKEYRHTEMHGIPLPNFNERVPFKEVMERKVKILKELLSKSKKKPNSQPVETELESLLAAEESE